MFDRWYSSLLGPTFPNRQYLFSAQSEGHKDNLHGLPIGAYKAETIWDRLAQTGVPAGYYHTDIPLLAMWGQDRMAPFIRSLDRYFEEAAAGTLPNVVFVEPGFGGPYRTDDHSRGDIGMAQRWVRDVFTALARSPQWSRSAFILVYDEGGGVDHRLYDHTSILRFLEWRFLGAPAEGPGKRVTRLRWALTTRDAHANNMGRTLRASQPDLDLSFDPVTVHLPEVSPPCTLAQLASHPPDIEPDSFDSPELGDLEATRFPGATYRPWLSGVDTK